MLYCIAGPSKYQVTDLHFIPLPGMYQSSIGYLAGAANRMPLWYLYGTQTEMVDGNEAVSAHVRRRMVKK